VDQVAALALFGVLQGQKECVTPSPTKVSGAPTLSPLLPNTIQRQFWASGRLTNP
jgi:hypothetical protein